MGGVSHNASSHSTLPPHGSPVETVPTAPPSLSPEQTEIQRIAQLRTEALLRDLWRRKLPMVRDHIRLLQRAQDTLASASLTGPLRAEAAIAVHKLAGSLGMFGYHEGTRLARELEALLDSTEAPPLPAFTALLRQLVATLPL